MVKETFFCSKIWRSPKTLRWRTLIFITLNISWCWKQRRKASCAGISKESWVKAVLWQGWRSTQLRISTEQALTIIGGTISGYPSKSNIQDDGSLFTKDRLLFFRKQGAHQHYQQPQKKQWVPNHQWKKNKKEEKEK